MHCWDSKHLITVCYYTLQLNFYWHVLQWCTCKLRKAVWNSAYQSDVNAPQRRSRLEKNVRQGDNWLSSMVKIVSYIQVCVLCPTLLSSSRDMMKVIEAAHRCAPCAESG